MQESPFIVHSVCLLFRELGLDEQCTGPACPLWQAGAIDELTCLVGHPEPALRRSPVLVAAAAMEGANERWQPSS